jgi:2-polyprenyl-3-methyl-5-hydroxy-6-metoxy-1,4-benzoquinol methylase
MLIVIAVSIDISDLELRAADFRLELARAKRAAAAESFWYPYDSMNNLSILGQMLTGEYRHLLDPGTSPVIADVGAADGDVAFLLNSLGCEVDIVDHAPTNFNGLEGARLLARQLNSTVRVVDTDLDHHFTLPRERYDVVLFLGILYHLKNPYNALECLARYTRHCILSTKISKFSADRKTRIADIPTAYLLGPTECNNDATNFWIFSEAGLRRLFERTGWNIVTWKSVGDPESDPADMAHDQRAYCLLENATVR